MKTCLAACSAPHRSRIERRSNPCRPPQGPPRRRGVPGPVRGPDRACPVRSRREDPGRTVHPPPGDDRPATVVPARSAHALRPLREHLPRRRGQRLPPHPARPETRLRALGHVPGRTLQGPDCEAVRSRPPHSIRPSAGPGCDAIGVRYARGAEPVRSLCRPGTPAASAQRGRDHHRDVQSGVARTGAPLVNRTRQAGRARSGARHKQLSDFGTLWRNPAVPDQLREEAIREMFERFDVDGPEIVAVHPQPNENAWLLGLVAAREGRLQMQQVMGLVGARGVEPTLCGYSSAIRDRRHQLPRSQPERSERSGGHAFQLTYEIAQAAGLLVEVAKSASRWRHMSITLRLATPTRPTVRGDR
jgi:hypothetical protein